jgi:HEPN domain-containing protein
MPLTMEEKYQYWLSYAQNDLDSAGVMLHSGRWFYTIFMCQQAIEKLVKGLYLLYIDDNVPRLHDINVIFARFKDELPESLSDANAGLFDTLSQFYVRSRYPDYTHELELSATNERAQYVYEKSKEAYQWLLTMKPRGESSANTSPM